MWREWRRHQRLTALLNAVLLPAIRIEQETIIFLVANRIVMSWNYTILASVFVSACPHRLCGWRCTCHRLSRVTILSSHTANGSSGISDHLIESHRATHSSTLHSNKICFHWNAFNFASKLSSLNLRSRLLQPLRSFYLRLFLQLHWSNVEEAKQQSANWAYYDILHNTWNIK